MSTEKIIKEIISKKCPFHGKGPIVGISEAGQIEISTCCMEFQQFLENIVKNMGIDEAGSSEIIKDG